MDTIQRNVLLERDFLKYILSSSDYIWQISMAKICKCLRILVFIFHTHNRNLEKNTYKNHTIFSYIIKDLNCGGKMWKLLYKIYSSPTFLIAIVPRMRYAMPNMIIWVFLPGHHEHLKSQTSCQNSKNLHWGPMLPTFHFVFLKNKSDYSTRSFREISKVIRRS